MNNSGLGEEGLELGAEVGLLGSAFLVEPLHELPEGFCADVGVCRLGPHSVVRPVELVLVARLALGLRGLGGSRRM